MKKQLKAALISMLLFLFAVNAIAQTSLSVLENRLSKTWNLKMIEQKGKTTKPDQGLNDFVLILKQDHSSAQGLNPDGLIPGKWSVNEKEMMLTIKDESMKQDYKMKIVSLTLTELILQDATSATPLKIYYQAK